MQAFKTQKGIRKEDTNVRIKMRVKKIKGSPFVKSTTMCLIRRKQNTLDDKVNKRKGLFCVLCF